VLRFECHDERVGTGEQFVERVGLGDTRFDGESGGSFSGGAEAHEVGGC
jgi:hypothetical protein